MSLAGAEGCALSTEDKMTRWQQVGVVAGVISALIAVIVLLLGGVGRDKNTSLPPPETFTSPVEASTSPTSVDTASSSESVSLGESPSPSPPVSEPPAAMTTTYVEDLPYTQDSEPYDVRAPANINGETYIHSQGAQFCGGDGDRRWTYNLGRKYDRLKATIGLDDNSPPNARVRYEVIADGKPRYVKTLGLGESKRLDIPVEGVLRVELISTTLNTKSSDVCGVTAWWGELRAEGAG
jgi:NPCBM/NEW2 domain-containing protein